MSIESLRTAILLLRGLRHFSPRDGCVLAEFLVVFTFIYLGLVRVRARDEEEDEQIICHHRVTLECRLEDGGRGGP